jgi:hypothetical protein
MECAIVNKSDFVEVISTWNAIYVSNYMNYEIQHRKKCGTNWKKGLLKVTSALTMLDDFKGTPVELMINKAINYSKLSDETKIQEVHELLHTVENYLNQESDFS